MAFTIIDKLVVLYLVLVNIVAFVMYGMDKSKAKKGQWRIPEKSLLFVAFVGGALGAFLGMRIFRHKTKHLQFCILVPFFLIAHIVLLVVLYTGAYYHADELALSMANADSSDGTVAVTNNSDSIFFDGPGSRDLMLFYQGAKVEPEAYAPLLENIASKGTDCYLLKAPLRLAVLNTQQAGSVDTSRYENVYRKRQIISGLT